MSHYVAVSHLPAEGEKLQTSKFVSWRSLFMLIGVVGLAVSLGIFFMGGEAAESFAYSYLFAFEVFFTITAGALFWVLLHNASNSSWGVAIRRIPEVMTLSFLPLFLLSIPLFGLIIWKPEYIGRVWEWVGVHLSGTTRDALGADHATLLLYKKYPFLHLGFDPRNSVIPGWDLRVIVYFAALGYTGWKLLGYSVSQDHTGQIQPTYSARRFSCGMLPVFAVASTFAAIDWIKTLNYTWFSTMFGVNVFAGSAMASMALIIIIVGFLIKTGHMKHVVTEEHFHIMGKLMHAFVIFWAYIAFSQFFLIWYANIPEETQFYAIRNTEGWWYVSLAMVILHFIVPFVVLLKRDNKRKLNVVMGTAAFLIAMHALELYWMIIPERGRALYDAPAALGGTFYRDLLFDALAFVTFAAIYGFVFLKNFAKHSIYPCGDPRLEESVNVVS